MRSEFPFFAQNFLQYTVTQIKIENMIAKYNTTICKLPLTVHSKQRFKKL